MNNTNTMTANSTLELIDKKLIPTNFFEVEDQFNILTRVIFFNGIYSKETSKYKLSPLVGNNILVSFINDWMSLLKSDNDHDYKIAMCAYYLSMHFKILSINGQML